MRLGIYTKLALESIKKNKKIYYPYIMTCSLMIAVLYILDALTDAPAVMSLQGSGVLVPILRLGQIVIIIFSFIFLLYSSAFVMKQRTHEFGLYSVLGLSKANVNEVILIESLITTAISLISGLFIGFVLSKLAELGLVNLLGGDIDYNLYISTDALIATVFFFLIVFFLIYLNSIRQVFFSDTITLLKSSEVGEKVPKGNWILGLSGLIILGIAYYLATFIVNPIDALPVFFIAVVLVIVATYLILISGSVYLCRLLKENKRFYYKPNRFISVSSMMYRMKRNGASLASICILATTVLVIISSTSCLYYAVSDLIEERYPREIDITTEFATLADLSDLNTDALETEINATVTGEHATLEDTYSYRTVEYVAAVAGDQVDTHVATFATEEKDYEIFNIFFVPLADYNRMTSSDTLLTEDQALFYSNPNELSPGPMIFNGSESLNLTTRIVHFPIIGQAAVDMTPSLVLIVPDLDQTLSRLKLLEDETQNPPAFVWTYNFNTGLSEENQIRLYENLNQMFESNDYEGRFNLVSSTVDSRAENRENYYSLIGGFLYIGIVLSVVFILAAVLIIYYKQVTEGYEDRERFQIMKKIGLTDREIKRSINSQLIIVFLIPLVFAVIHLIFAFPMIQKLLLLFSLSDVTLFATATVISVLIFALIYIVVYVLTSNVYYKIVARK